MVKFGNDSLVGESVKDKVLRNYKLVEFVNLNEPGDARFKYFDPESKSVSVSIVSVNIKEPNKNVDLWVGDMISQTVNKSANVGVVSNIAYAKTRILTDADLSELRKRAISHKKADLYLIYTSSYAEKETAVGLVLHGDTIFIFRDALGALSEKESVKDILEQTTIMHEWGHLLGLDHVNDGACIMNEIVDVYDYPPIGANLPTKYCLKELQLIKQYAK
ncbi:hypothetical protein ACFL25_00010 [Patescibacteria group bacterium]